MILIRNTLLSVLLLQLLAFSYIKFFYKKEVPNLTHLVKIDSIPVKVVTNTIKKNHMMDNKPTVTKEIHVAQKKVSPPNIKKIINIARKQVSIKKKSLKKISNISTKVEKYAKKFLGYKYVWGATGPKTFDCSGFTQKVYKQSAGIVIPRVSRNQAKVGKYIKYSELKKGDMVFFDTTKERLGKVNHVGIYLSNGNFIHASSGGKRVMITNFNKKRFYKNRFLWGRRIIQEHTAVARVMKKKNKEES